MTYEDLLNDLTEIKGGNPEALKQTVKVLVSDELLHVEFMTNLTQEKLYMVPVFNGDDAEDTANSQD